MNHTVLYQLELNQGEVNCGMSYVVQLPDGRFVIIDGGYFTSGEEDRLYRFLEERSPDPVVIAGWFFTHPHQDHVGCFIHFTKRHSSKVCIEKLYFNNVPMDLSQVEGDYQSSDPATIKEFYRVVETYFPKEAVHTIKTGERIDFGGVVFEALYTQENLYPTESTFNDYGTVLMMEAGGQKTLFLGDVYTLGSEWLLKNKLEKLPCDIVQISHHGYGGATQELYEALGATVALWPTPDYRMSELRERAVNRYLLEKSEIQEHIVAGQGTAELTLPYQPGQAKRLPKAFFHIYWTKG